MSLLGWEWLAAIGGIIALAATWLGGRKSGKTAVKLDAAQKELAAHDRLNETDTGADLTDDERVERLRAIARRLGI